MNHRSVCSLLLAGLSLGAVLVVAAAPGGGASSDHSALLTADGTVWTAGSNYHGAIGDGTTEDRHVRVAVLSGASDIAVGGLHTVAVVGGVAMAWGHGTLGQLCDDLQMTHREPTPIPSHMDVVRVGAAGSVTYLVKGDGTLFSCGSGSHGLIGDGSFNVLRKTPVQVPGVSDAIAVAGGTSHVLVLRANGTVLSWGDGSFGKLGEGTTTARLTPGAVPGLSNNVAVGAGYHHSLALDATGRVWAWGTGFYGTLGQGTTTDHYAPVQVPGLTGCWAMGQRSTV